MDPNPLNLRALQTPRGGGVSKPGQATAARVVHLLAATVALLVAAYLTNEKWQGRITNLAGCGGEEGCSQLLGGRWANWMLVPVSFWALTVYAPLLILGLLGITTRRRVQLAWIGSGILVAAALWFLGLQLFVEHRFCKYCFAMHTCSVVLLATTAFHARSLALRETGTHSSTARSAWIAGTAAGAALLLGQLFGPQPATHQLTEGPAAVPSSPTPPPDTPASSPVSPETAPSATAPPASANTATAGPASATAGPPSATAGPASATAGSDLPDLPDLPSQDAPAATSLATADTAGPKADPSSPSSSGRPLRFLDGALVFDLQEVPVIGSVQASSVVVKYFDYTCKSCRTMHGELEAIQKQYPGQLAVVMLPCPLDRNCNPHAPPGPAHRDACVYARLGLAVWRADRSQFARFHDEMFQLQGRLTPAIARQKASELVGEAALKRAEQDPWIGKTLDQTFAIYRIMARQNPRMPKVVLGGTVILHGVTVSQRDLVNALEKYAGLKSAPPATP
jgi:uncharacterized membrane protein